MNRIFALGRLDTDRKAGKRFALILSTLVLIILVSGCSSQFSVDTSVTKDPEQVISTAIKNQLNLKNFSIRYEANFTYNVENYSALYNVAMFSAIGQDKESLPVNITDEEKLYYTSNSDKIKIEVTISIAEDQKNKTGVPLDLDGFKAVYYMSRSRPDSICFSGDNALKAILSADYKDFETEIKEIKSKLFCRFQDLPEELKIMNSKTILLQILERKKDIVIKYKGLATHTARKCDLLNFKYIESTDVDMCIDTETGLILYIQGNTPVYKSFEIRVNQVELNPLNTIIEVPEHIELPIKLGSTLNQNLNSNQNPSTNQLEPNQSLLQVPPLNLEKIKKAVEQGGDVNVKDYRDFTPIHIAAFHGPTEVVEYLIDKGADVNSRSNSESTPLHSAIAADNFEIAKILIQKGADVNAKTNSGNTPLHETSRSSGTEILDILINKGAQLESKDMSGDTPLLSVAFLRNEAVFKHLLNKGASPCVKNDRNKTIYDYFPQDTETSKLILGAMVQAGCNPLNVT